MYKSTFPTNSPTMPLNRTVLGAEGVVEGKSTGIVEGWLDKATSDFTNDDGQPAALWHVKYTNGPLAGDEV